MCMTRTIMSRLKGSLSAKIIPSTMDFRVSFFNVFDLDVGCAPLGPNNCPRPKGTDAVASGESLIS